MSDLYRAGPCDRCGQPGSRYINAHLCPDHAPQHPTPDPALTLAGLRQRAGIVPMPLPEIHPRFRQGNRHLDTNTPLDDSLGTFEEEGPHLRWSCGLCNVSGLTSPASAPVALQAHLKYRHPNRAAKVAARLQEAQAAPVED